MSLLNKLEQLSNKEKVFIFCNNEKTPILFYTKIISTSAERKFVVFESKKHVKIGVKIIHKDIKYSKFNKKANCLSITNLISEKNEIEFGTLLLKTKMSKQKELEKQLTIKKKLIPTIKVTSGNYTINSVRTTLKQELKTYIKKLIEIDKIYRGFVELLGNEKSNYSSRDAHIFVDLIPNKKKLLEIQKIINIEYQPILKNLLQNNFNLTNISPVVLDKKKIFIRDEHDNTTLKKTNEQLNNTFLIKNLLTKHDDAISDDIGDISLELNIGRNFIKRSTSESSVKTYIDFIRKLNGHDGINLETTLDKEFTKSSPGKTISYTPPHLSYLLPERGYIKDQFYPITLKNTTTLFRHSYNSDNKLNTACASLKFDEEGKFTLTHEDSNKIISRKSNEAIYSLKDVYDDIKIGNTKTCNGTNKSGDIFYLGKDFKSSELNKSQSTPPQKIPIYEGEKVYVSGFFIHSPTEFKRVIGGSEIYDFEKNSKEYTSLYSNYKTLVDIKDPQIKPKPIRVVENIANFSLVNNSDYNPKYDYFVLIGSVNPSETKNKLNKDQWDQHIKSIAPSLKQIFNILNSELEHIRGVKDVEILLNKYYFSFSQFPQTPFINILKNKIYQNNKVVKELSNEHYKNMLNLRNQSEIMNTLFRELLQNEEDVYPFLDFLNKYTLKKTLHKKLLKKLYGFISGKKLRSNVNIEEQLLKLVSRNFKNNLLNNLDADVYDQIKNYYNKLNKSNLVYQNSQFCPRTIEYISNNSANEYLSKNILKEIIELANLYKIRRIIKEEEEKYNFNMEKKIDAMEDEIKTITFTYNEERERQVDFLNRCKGIRIVKEYNSIKKVNSDNIGDVYRDLKYDTLYSDLKVLFNIVGEIPTPNSSGIRQLKDINSDIKDAFENALVKKYIYMDKNSITLKFLETIEFYDKFRFNAADTNLEDILNLIDNYDEDNKTMFYNLSISTYPLRNAIKPDDIALLETRENKYLFKRSGTIWHIVTEEEFTGTTKAFIYDDKNILKLKVDELEKLFTKIQPPSVGDGSYCINVEQYSIPIDLYNLISDISNKRLFIKNSQIILKYKATIEDNIAAKIADVEQKFKLQSLKIKKQQIPHDIITKARKPSLIPKTVISKYLDIFKIKSFDDQIEGLLEFVELYGINYCLNDSCEESEKSSDTSNSYYYNSSKFVMKLCCKHYMCYKDFNHKTNEERSEILEQIKSDYGVVSEDHHICKLCGETIDTIKDSSFEGFDRSNALITFREAVKDEGEIELYEEDLSIRNENEFYNTYTKKPEILALKYIITELGISLSDTDFKFILTEIEGLSASKLYDNFIKTNVIKKCMIKIFKFTQSLNSKKSSKDTDAKKSKKKSSKDTDAKKKKKKKKKKKGTQVGGTIIDTKLNETEFERLKKSKFVKEVEQKTPDDYSDLEKRFTKGLQEEINKFNLKNPHNIIPVDDNLLLKNIGDVNRLLQFLTKNSDTNIIIIVLLANIQQLFNMYIRGYKFIMALKYLTVILQYSLPEYKINPYLMISKIPSLRTSGKNYLIQNLYYSRDYIIDSIFKIIENTLSNKKTSTGFYIKKIISIFDNILGGGLKFSPIPRGKVSKETKKQMFLNNLIIFENLDISSLSGKQNKLRAIKTFFMDKIKTETDNIIVQVEFINNLKVKRLSYEHEREFKEDFTLKWNEFLPVIDTDKVNRVDLSDTYEINQTTVVSIYELNKHLTKLCNNYIFLINELLNIVSTPEDMTYYSYTSSTTFSNIILSFTDYFNIENFETNKIGYPLYLEEDPIQKTQFVDNITELQKILTHMNILNTKLSYQKNVISSPIYIITNNNNYTRNLQEYTNFEILYEDKPLIYYINRLKLLFTTYYINKGQHLNPTDTNIINKKRSFKTIKDTHYEVVADLLKEQIENSSSDESGDLPPFNLINRYTELIADRRNIIVDEILKQSPDEELGDTEIFFRGDNEGVYNIDIETGEFKEKIEYSIEKEYLQKDIPTVKSIIEIIESKIYKVYDKCDQEVTFTEDITFKNNYILTISKIDVFLRNLFTDRGEADDTVGNLTDIINISDDEAEIMTNDWSELNGIKFATSIGVIQESALSNLDDNTKTLFTEIFIENNHQLESFYIEKFEEIANDLRIILFEDEIEQEQLFYKNKFKSDNQQSTLSIFIYLLKFLMCKSLMIYKNYKNNILSDVINESYDTKLTLDTEDANNISEIYRSRYIAMDELGSISNLDTYMIKYDEICKNISIVIDLINENDVSLKHNIILVKDLTLKLLYTVNTLFADNIGYIEFVNTLFSDEVTSIFETFKTREYDIQNYMNIKKTKGNQNRKRQFDKKSDEDKLSHKLYRRFNLGKILDLSDNVYKETTTAAEPDDAGTGYDTFDGNADF